MDPTCLEFIMDPSFVWAEPVKANAYIRQEIKSLRETQPETHLVTPWEASPEKIPPACQMDWRPLRWAKGGSGCNRKLSKGLDQNTLRVLKAIGIKCTPVSTVLNQPSRAFNVRTSLLPQPHPKQTHGEKKHVLFCQGCTQGSSSVSKSYRIKKLW